MALQWYVLQAYSNYEKKVKLALEEKIKTEGKEEYFGKVLVPIEEVVEMRDGQQHKSERRFLPGYVLAQIDLNDETWHLVRNIPRILGFIGGTPDNPTAISDKEVDIILSRVEDSVNKPSPKVLFEVGEVVRVIDGPFQDFNGNIEEVNYEKSRVKISVLIFGRSTPVELEFGQIEKQ